MPKPGTLRQLGGPPGSGGYIFALLYSTGVVQVGRTVNARAEVNARRGTARSLGISLSDWWVSEPVQEWVGGERSLAGACRDLGGRETGAGSFSGVDFAALCGRAHHLRLTDAPGRRPHSWNPDERMAVAARLRAEGLSLRESAGRMLVSHGTVRRDLIRWDRAEGEMPPDIARLSLPVTQPRYIASAARDFPAPEVTAPCNTAPNVIRLRRPA